MVLAKMVEEADATGLVREIYDDIKATRNIEFVPNAWKVLASHPPTLARTWNDLKDIMKPGALDPVVKEMIAVAVSTTNGCRYSIRSHTLLARKAGMTDEMFGELMAVIGMFNESNRLIEGYCIDMDEFLLDQGGGADAQ